MAPYTNGKRKFDAIDLTGDDDVGSSFRAPRASPGDVSQSQRDSWLEQGDEADAGDIIISSQDGDDSVTQSFQLYGTLRSQLGWFCRSKIPVSPRHSRYQDCGRPILYRPCDTRGTRHCS